MADTPATGGILARLARFVPWSSSSKAIIAPASGAIEVKVESPSSLLPRYTGGGGFTPDFIPLDAHGQVIDILGHTGLAFVAYWYVACRWRAQKIAEAPLIVVAEDQETGAEEWIADHELALVLDEPSLDYDMGELLERTSRYLDDGGSCLWVIDRDRAARAARLTPFKRGQFEIEKAPGRLFGRFAVSTSEGRKTFEAEQVVYFRDTYEGWGEDGRSRLDVALTWLRLSEQARRTIHDLLGNAVWPSLVLNTDPTWNPGPEELERFKQELNRYAQPGERGKAFANIGGGSAEILSARIRDLVPTEVLDRVESLVAAISGVPAIVLQYQVGLENSPWSQMEQARKMAYEDTIQPTWRRFERALTRQLLRTDDEDRSHFIRFDQSRIPSLQINRDAAAVTASILSRIGSLNERRELVGWEASNDPRADEIPELTQPLFPPPGSGDPDDENDDDEPEPEEKAARRRRRRQRKVAAMSIALRGESTARLDVEVGRLLSVDAREVERLLLANLSETTPKSAPVWQKAERGKQRALAAVLGYLKNTSEPAWRKAADAQLLVSAERATAVIAADIGVSYTLLHPHVVSFAKREAGRLVKGISATTADAVGAAVARGLEEGKSVGEIARAVADSGAFSSSRARLIARTESTRASAGAPTEALKAHGVATGREYVKTWSGALDERERDEHVALEGETVKIGEAFSNGLQFPSEPNCRCAPIFSEVEA